MSTHERTAAVPRESLLEEYPGSSDPDEVEARAAVAGVIRELGHALVGRSHDRSTLHRAAAALRDVLEELEQGDRRHKVEANMAQRYLEELPREGDRLDRMPERPFSGIAAPSGLPLEVVLRDGWAVTRCTLGPAHEGAPGRSHGGFVAAIYDDLTGYVLGMLGVVAFTGELVVRYLDGTPIGRELLFRTRLRERNGRKLLIEAECWAGAVKVSEATSLFIQVPSERLGLAPGLRTG